MKTYPLRWPGKSRSQLSILSPNDASTIAHIEQISLTDIDWIARNTLAGQKKINLVSADERATWLKNISQKIKSDADILAQLIATEGGKPLKDARVEVQRAALTFELCAEETLRIHTEHPASLPKKAFTVREPIGPVLALSAFNHPLNLLAHQVGSALAAGCSVVLKPSPGTPLCAEWLKDTLNSVGVPDEVVILCHAQISEIEALVARAEFQFVSFIGSAKVGWELRRKIAPGTRLALEHGGVAPAVICEDADLELASTALCKGAFYHAGQVCISTQKIFVHKSVYLDFSKLFIEKAKRLVVGDARDEKTDVGPLIRPIEKARLLNWIEEARTLGAKVLLEDSLDRGPQYLGPTILAEVSLEAQIWREEAFGPVVCLSAFDDINPIYQALEECPYHFSASIFTKNQDRALEAAKLLPAMSVVVNDHTAWRVDAMPFGGHRQSGLGMGGVRWAVEEQTRLKLVSLNGV
jgi:acyl-CoA reductase-like NAD-dependent aldehyde dehydrogenase